MCGFAGRVNVAGPVSAHALDEMGALLRHRGPDDVGSHLRGRAGLVHRRLAIVDRAGGRQPLANEDETVWVAFNGEIYNHVEVRRALEGRHTFRTRSDTETIVHAYEEDGAGCVLRLRGMFAFAVWDEPRGRLLLARDRLGEKPIYYAHTSCGDLLFASEAKALLAVPEVDRSLDGEAIDAFLSLRFVPAPLTPWRGIRKLPPASRLVWQDGGLRVDRYWGLPLELGSPPRPLEAIAASDLRDRIDRCVEERLMGEVPVGTFLSGGIDSTDITAAMVKARRGERVHTFAVGYRGPGGDEELSYARHAAAELGTVHHEVVLEPEAVRDELERIVWHLDEPLADAACVPLYFLARRAKQDVTVILSGEGGDEILAGYGAYRRQQWLSDLRRRFGRGAALVAHALALAPDARLRSIGRSLALPLERAYTGVPGELDPRVRRALGLADTGVAARHLAPLWDATRSLGDLRRLLYLDLALWLADDLLAKADRITMASALELRVPFLDHELVEWTWALPDDFKIRRRTGKYLLRRAARGRVPRVILERPKRGFPVPMSRWMRGPLRDLTRDVLASLPDFDRAGVRAALRLQDEHERGAEHGESLYRLLIFGLWRRVFAGSAARAPSGADQAAAA